MAMLKSSYRVSTFMQTIAAATVLCGSAGALAATATLVKDINTGAGSSNDSVGSFAVLNGVAYFRANDGATGFELWRSNGTSAGTERVMDINPGALFSFPTNIRAANGKLFFSATDRADGSGAAVWASDGTAAGTQKLADLYPGLPATPFGVLPDEFTALNGSTVLFTSPSPQGTELFRTDGTPEGTRIVKDIHPGPTDSFPGGITVLNGVAYFTADDSFITDDDGFAIFDRELFRSDGTEAGTFRVKDINPGTPGSRGTGHTLLNNQILFTAETSDHGTELWSTDGSTGGTQQLADLNPGPDGSGPEGMTRIGNKIFFAAYEPTTGVELYITDGTAAGTNLVKDINAGGQSVPVGFTEFDGKAVFQADDGVHGSEVWISDGTDAGTHILIDLNTGETESGPQDFAVVGDKLFFVSIIPNDENFTVQTQLWMTDGTEAGTELVFTEPGHSFGYAITNLTVLGNTLLFYAPGGVDADGFSIDTELYSVKVPEPTVLMAIASLIPLARRRR